MSRTFRRKHVGAKLKELWISPRHKVFMVDGVLMERSGSSVGMHPICGLRGRAFFDAEAFCKWNAARYHSDVPFNHPTDTYLRRRVNKSHRLKTKVAIHNAIRTSSEDSLSLLPKKRMPWIWLD